jgi:hypothetical protein
VRVYGLSQFGFNHAVVAIPLLLIAFLSLDEFDSILAGAKHAQEIVAFVLYAEDYGVDLHLVFLVAMCVLCDQTKTLSSGWLSPYGLDAFEQGSFSVCESIYTVDQILVIIRSMTGVGYALIQFSTFIEVVLNDVKMSKEGFAVEG